MKRIFLFIAVIAIVTAILLIIIKWWKAISPIIGGWNSAILTLLELVGLVIALALASFVLYQFIRRFFLNQWIFAGFSNESNFSGLLATELKTMSFHMLAMEELVRQSQIVSKQWNQYNEGLLGNAMIIGDNHWKAQLPKGFINDEDVIAPLRPDIFDWVKSAEDKVPQGFAFIMSLISFVGATIPAPIVKITGHIQFLSNNKAGITLEVVDAKKPHNNAIYTFWQDDEAASSLAQSSAALEDKRRPIDGYIELLSPTMRWLAQVRWKQKVESRITLRNFFSGNRKREKAKLFYRLGTLFYTSTVEFTKHKSIFFQLAINHLNQALDADQNWYYPSLYLANVYSFEMQDKEDESHEKLLKEVLYLYEEALDRAKRAGEDISTKQRIILSKALAELVSGLNTYNERHINQAIQGMEYIKKESDPADFDAERADCATFLYNLATWYELAYDNYVPIPNVKPREEARRYLAYCLARSQDLWNEVEKDINFQSMRNEGDLEMLKEELHKKLKNNPELAKLTGQMFKYEIDGILEEVDRRLRRSPLPTF